MKSCILVADVEAWQLAGGGRGAAPVPLGGVNGYHVHGVRRQGRKSEKFQGTTPQKIDKLFDTPRRMQRLRWRS